MLNKITLYGELAEKFGKTWEFDLNTPNEVFKALNVNIPEFQAHILEAEQRGMGYKMIIGDSYIEDVRELGYPVGRQEIKVIPVIAGSKNRGLGLILMGAMIMGGFYLAGQAAFAGTAAAGQVGVGHVINVGAHSVLGSYGMIGMKFAGAMILGGIASMLAPTPTTTDTDRPTNYGFDGPVNTTKQGFAIPVCYGQLIVGGAVISSGIEAEDYTP